MVRHPNPLPSTLGPVFTAAEAQRAGVRPHRLQQPDLIRLARGIYARATLASTPYPAEIHPAERWRRRQRELAELLAPFLPQTLFYTGRTAAALWNLPAPTLAPRGTIDHTSDAVSVGGLDVATFQSGARLRTAGFNLSRLRPGCANVIERYGVRSTSPASTWAQLAPRLTRDEAVALGDAVIREARIPGTSRLERDPHATLADLEALASAPRRRGSKSLRDILPLLSPHAASPPESHLRLRISDWGLPAPEVDYDVYSESGLLLGCSELAWPAYGIAAEYEGSHHRVETHQWNRDIAKYHDYAAAGWEVIRVTADALYVHRHELRDRLTTALRRRGWAG